MKRILPLVLCVMPISTLAATPSEILSKGEILASYPDGGFFWYDVVYKKTIYRCYTSPGRVECYQLKSVEPSFYNFDN